MHVRADTGEPPGDFRARAAAANLEVAVLRLMKYGVVIEKSENRFDAYVPDLPGCAAVGETVEETRRLIKSAIVMHLKAMREDGDPVPEPSTVVDYVEVA